MKGFWLSLPITIVFPLVLFTGCTKGLLAPGLPRYFRDAVLDTLAQRQLQQRSISSRQERIASLLKSKGRGPLSSNDVYIAAQTSRLVFRSVAARTNEQTLITTVLPLKVFTGNSLNYLIPWKFDVEQAFNQLNNTKACYKSSLPSPILAYLCGVLNSFTLDYVLRFKVSANLNMFYVYQLPVPRLTPDDLHCRAIARQAAQLVCIGPEFDGLRAEVLGSVEVHVATEAEERQRLQNEIDALVAHLYGLSEEDRRHILYAPYTFPLVKREVKDGVMEAFGRVEELLEEED